MSSFANYNVAGSPSGSAGGRGNDNSRSHDDAEKPSADNVSLSELETAMKLLPMLQQLTAQPPVTPRASESDWLVENIPPFFCVYSIVGDP